MFAALAPIYREEMTRRQMSAAATAAASFAIELGKPMFWLIAAATAGSVFFLLRASLQRGRDSSIEQWQAAAHHPPAAVLQQCRLVRSSGSSSIAAAVIGLGIAQSKKRQSETLRRAGRNRLDRRAHNLHTTTPKFWILRLLDPEPMILTGNSSSPTGIGSNCRALEHDENEVSSSGRILVPAQPVDATQALNLSAGVSNAKVFRGRSFS